ncbi:MAG: hypothetical protein LBH24_01090, partial [Clostridiales bacterium]|nr:hypothetical protein [Clostridiales bacterium]
MKLGTSFRRLRTFAIVTALFLLSAVCMLTGSISAEGIWSTDDAIVLADAYPGSESSYEMPDESALDETLTIKKESGGDTYSVTDKGGNVIASALANMAAVRNEIEKKLVPSGGSFKLFFNCITMADQEYFQLPAVEGSIILSGDLTGNLSSWSASGGSSDRGVLVIDPQATQQNVYLYDFALTNTGSMQYAEANVSGSLVPANPDKRLGRDRPNGLVVNSGTTGYANVFVLGGSSIRVTNEVFFSSYKEFRYDPKALGYASNTSLPGLGAAGFGREMSLAIPKVSEDILYPEEVESAKDYLLRLAYELHLRPGVTEEEAAIKLNYYKGRPLNEWVRSTRDFAANDFGDIYTYSTTSGGVTTYHIDTTQPPTGNAIRFLSAGSLVIDT